MPERYTTKISRSLLRNRSKLTDIYSSAGLTNLLQMTRFAEFSIPHDRVFALLGLLSPEDAALIKVDYNQPVFEVFKNACSAHFEQRVNLDFLQACDCSTDGQNLYYPSWVPDWSTWRFEDVFMLQFAAGSSRARDFDSQNSQLTVDGILCGVVEKVCVAAPTQGKLRSSLLAWEELAKSNDRYWKKIFVETLACGEYKENSPEVEYPRRKAYRKAYDDYNNEPLVSESIRGRSIFKTSSGSLGICPKHAKTGDLLVVILGCDMPMVLRSLEQEPLTYIVIGPAFVGSLGYSQALLGPLPNRYKITMVDDWQGFKMGVFRDQDDGTATYDDPRLGPLPNGWQFKREYAPSERVCREFVNMSTGESTYYDPRMTAGELRKRGTKVEEFVLV